MQSRRKASRYCCLLMIVLLGGVLRGEAQTLSGGAIKALEDALSRGDVETLLSRAAPQIEIALFEASRLYSRGQARYVLKTFFKQYPPRRFVLRDYYRTHNGWYAEGDYWYARSDRPLRLYLRLRRHDRRWELREILIEEAARR